LGPSAPRGSRIRGSDAGVARGACPEGDGRRERRLERAPRRRLMSITSPFFADGDGERRAGRAFLSLRQLESRFSRSLFFPHDVPPLKKKNDAVSTRPTPRSPRALAGPSPSRPTSSCSGRRWAWTPASPSKSRRRSRRSSTHRPSPGARAGGPRAPPRRPPPGPCSAPTSSRPRRACSSARP